MLERSRDTMPSAAQLSRFLDEGLHELDGIG